MSPDSLHSYHRFMRENFFQHVNLDPRHTHIPRGDLPRAAIERHCRDYEEKIREAGGIDFQILGIGQTGHIGFNEPGSSPDSRTRLVVLDTITRRDGGRRLLRRRERSRRGDHDGRGDDPRGARDRADRDR